MQNRRQFLRTSAAGAAAALFGAQGMPPARAAAPPNVVVILADDLGYGDLSCYGATKVETPNIDRLARQGVRFTDAHSPSPICTPTRYAMLTGEYYWRIGPNHGHLWNHSRKYLIQEDRTTMGQLFQQAGYDTACIGKWHLGFGEESPDWNGELKPGAREAGFDYFFGVPNANSEAPFAYAENRRLVGLDPDDPIVIPGEDQGNYGKQLGGAAARWVEEDMAITLTKRAVSYLEERGDDPFFLYFAPCNVHVPITPNERFQGTSDAGRYGDFVRELDWAVGEVMNALDRMGAADNTLVVFSSDNGAVVHRELLEYGHDPNSVFIGQKTDIWEGGQRVPFIARWPERVPAGQTSADMVCLVDMLATSAALLGQDLPADAGPDSFNILPSILCEPGRKPPRETMVLGWPGWALRDSSWLYIPHQGSGGVTTQPGNPAGEGWVNLAEAGFENSDYDEQGKLKENAPPGQLYDLAEDPDQTVNLFRDYPNRVAMMDALLERIKDKGERLVTR